MLALKSWRCRRALVIAALLWVTPASAQDPVDPNQDGASVEAGEPSEIERILVTGERQSTLQDAPTSSTSFSAGDLQALRIETIADLANYTPNLEIKTAFAASNPTIFIRGIGLKDYNANAAGAVAVYQDGVNINSPAIQLGQLFDIDGIDVLRGPQGSVNGRNATAGAIMIRSAMPDGEFSVSSSFTYGNYSDREVAAAINVPLIKDMLSMRVSGTAQLRDGYTKNQCAGWDPEALGFKRVDEEANSILYRKLRPTGQYDQNGVVRKVQIRRQNSPATQTQSAFVYLNYQLAQGPDANGDPGARTYASGITPGVPQNPWVLAEDLVFANGDYQQAIDSNGSEVDARAPYIDAFGNTVVTPVAKMAGTLHIDDVDLICVLSSPGRIATLLGEANNQGKPDAENWANGNWQPARVQPGLEDFAGLKRWTNNIDNWAARMVLLFEPLDNMEWMFNAHGTQNRGDSLHFQMLGAASKFNVLGFFENRVLDFSENSAASASGFRLGEGTRNVRGIVPNPNPLDGPGTGGGNPHSGFYDSDGIEFIDAWGINGRGFWDLGAATITLLYDYEWYDRVVENEGDANPSRIIPAIWSDSAWQTTEELRVEGDGKRYKWTAGFFFLHEELNAGNLFPHIRQYEIDQRFSQTLTSWAPYASGEVDLVEEGVIPGIYGLTLSAGARYNQEKKEFSLVSLAIGTTSLIGVIELPEEIREATWKEWTGDVQLSYTPFSNEYGTLRSYLKYGHGFKGGHFNAGLTIKGGHNVSQEIDPVEPEFIDAVEFGLRTRWLDDRLIFNAAIFRYWYQDLQVFDFANDYAQLPVQKLLNGDADVLGAEAELRVKPIPGFLISANMGWLDSAFKKFVVTKGGVRFDYAGNKLVAAPTWNFAMIIKYEAPLFGWGSLVPQWDCNYRSKAYLDPQMVDPISQGAYWLHNARITYRTPDERIELAFWISNLLDEEYKVDVLDRTRVIRTILEVWGEPRTYGVTLSLNW